MKVFCRPTFQDAEIGSYRENTATSHHWIARPSPKGRCRTCSKRDLAISLAKEVFDKLKDSSYQHVPYVVWHYFAVKIRPGYFKRNDSKAVYRMSSTYRCAVSVTLMTFEGVRLSKEMAP
ncbi:hypothetical protein TNCV_530961 [Trichonephila clavipes]|nr:hypothetical protein TNCV_530961 [Trichonephila clavipes]